MFPWLSSVFLNPAYVLPGAALIAAPILIHLINRLRYRRVKFAAMEFLLQSVQRNRRRLLLEQLLLLLLRILVVLAIVALIARPILDPRQLALFTGQKTHHLVLLDDSGSMRDRWGESTAFARAKEVVTKIAAEGARRPGTQMLTLMLLSRPDQPIYVLKPLDDGFLAELESRLKSIDASHRALDPAAGLAAAGTLLAEQPAAARTLHFLSDFRQREWESESALAASLQDLGKQEVTVNLIKTVPEQHANLGLTELSGSLDVAAAGVPLRLTATVHNYSPKLVRDVRLQVLVDGKPLPVSVVVDELEGGRSVSREFDVAFPSSGPHEVRVLLPVDALEQDNARHLALTVPESNPVLIIDGGSGSDDAFYLQDALAPAPGITGFAPTVESPEVLRRQPIQRYQSVFLVNVSELPPDSVRALEQYVAAGGGLIWFLGDQVRPAFYNDKLYRPTGGLFPLRLGSVTELFVEEEAAPADVTFSPHPAFRVFEGDENPFIDSVKVARYFSAARDWTPDDGVQTIARLRNKSPLFLEHRLGKGTILTCLSSAGPLWNNWSLNPSYVPLMLEIARHAARSGQQLDQRIVGQPIAIALDAATYSPQVEIRRPDGTAEKLTAVIVPSAATPRSGSPAASSETSSPTPPAGTDPTSTVGAPFAPEPPPPQFVDEFAGTDLPGLYTLVQKRVDGEEELRRFAYNVPEAESELALTSSDQLKQRIGPDVRVQIQEVGSFDFLTGEETGQEIHDLVLLVLLALLLGEQLLALRLSFHPSTAGARA